MTLEISNRQARHLWLHVNGLAKPPTGKLTLSSLSEIIETLGFVQLDSIQMVARAHHHILWSRNQNYREPMLAQLLEQRAIFEHFTHDASVLPMTMYPVWQCQFSRMKTRLEKRGGWAKYLPSTGDMNKIRMRIEREGPLSTKDFKSNKADKSVHPWMRPQHKLTLDYLWYIGELATHSRKNFIKYYDLAERVIPADIRQQKIPETEQVDWLCHQALQRLGMARAGDVQRFWDAVHNEQASQWMADHQSDLIALRVRLADGSSMLMHAPADIEDMLATLKSPPQRLRIISPFDPAVRDRDRLLRLFGFHYRIEIFIPAKKRQYGYYIYPMLEGDRFVGRIEVKADRKSATLQVLNLWWEEGVALTPARRAKLDAELMRLARFIGVELVE